MKLQKFIYAGNRSTVLKKMVECKLNVVKIIATAGSFLEKELGDYKIPSRVVNSKDEAIKIIKDSDFDCFISTGFKYVLPISELLAIKKNRLFINIHPSYLPDLRGADPIPGAVLFERDSGVTCHLMDEGIDTGPVVAQIKIPYNQSFNARDLYKSCFDLEPRVFEQALKNDFAIFNPDQISEKLSPNNYIYYTYKSSDSQLSLTDDIRSISRKVHAFNTPSKGLMFSVDEKVYKAYSISQDAKIELNSSRKINNFEVLGNGSDFISFALDGFVVRLFNIVPEIKSSIKGLLVNPPQLG